MTIPTHHLNINDLEFIAKPYEQLKIIRKEMPVFRDETWDKVFFFLHADISSLLKDKRLGRTMLHRYSREEIGWPPPDPKLAGWRSYQDNVFMDMEGDSHRRIRSLATKVFTPKKVESLRTKLESTTHKLIDAVEKNKKCNFVSDIAEPLPVIMIADLLGIPEEHHHKLRPWSAAIVKMYELGYTDEQVNEANKTSIDFMNLIGELANERRKNPQDDLITDLVQVESAGETLTENEMRATAIFLLNAGHEATVNGSALGLMSLFQNQNQFEVMQEAVRQNNQSLIKTAVDELLRYETPLPMFERYVLEDMEINGVQLKRGDEVGLFYISGNHDEKRFERAGELVLSREDNPLLTFGLGTHYCLGAPLARLELQVLFSVLFNRLPNLQADGDAKFSNGFVIRGLENLPIKF